VLRELRRADAVGAGRAMAIRLAEPLELSLQERNELPLAAGYAPIYPRW
jgi:hypothetical protein